MGEVLVQRITGRAMETDVNKMVPEFQNFDSPFIAIMREFNELNIASYVTICIS